LTVVDTEGIVNITVGANTFSLRHGYRIVIQDLPAGTTFTVTEAATQNFQPQATTTIPGTGSFALTGGVGEALTTASHPVGTTDDPTTVVFTNFYNWVPPTGLSIAGMSLLPFIVVALGLIALFARSKRVAIETMPLA